MDALWTTLSWSTPHFVFEQSRQGRPRRPPSANRLLLGRLYPRVDGFVSFDLLIHHGSLPGMTVSYTEHVPAAVLFNPQAYISLATHSEELLPYGRCGGNRAEWLQDKKIDGFTMYQGRRRLVP